MAPQARTPQRQIQRKAADMQRQEESFYPGGPVCPQCGISNPAHRLFCRRCGASLHAAPVAPRLSWWQRLWRALTGRRHKPIAAGARPGRRREAVTQAPVGRRRRLRVGSMAGIAAVLVAIAAFAGPWRSSIVDRVQSVVHKAKSAAHVVYVPVHPVSATATSAAPGHPAGAAIDTVRQTYWATAAPNSGIGQQLVLTLDGTSRLDKVRFISGASSEPGQFVTEPRVHTVTVLADGRPVTTLTLSDSPNPQTFSVSVSAVHQVGFVVRSVYAGTRGTSTSVAEIELFARKS